MPFIVTSDTKRLTPPSTLPGISEGDWIDIRTIYTAGMRKRIMQSALSVNTSGGEPTAAVDIFASRQTIVQEIVVAWSDPSAVTPEALEQLHPDVQDWIAQQYDDLIKPPRSDDEKKDSSAAS